MPFRAGAPSANPKGRPKGSRDVIPRSAKKAVLGLLQRFGANEKLLTSVLKKGLDARPPSSFPYLRLIIEHQVGQPDLAISTKTTIVHEHHDT